jgi:SAM-dependent methyltransferase
VLTLDYDRLGLRPGDRVLDVGCGEGRHSFEAYRRGASLVVPLDLDVTGLGVAKNTLWLMNGAGEGAGRFLAVRGDAGSIPFADGFFDCVICSETLEHIRADRAVMRELVRVVRPGGRIGISVPSYGPERICWALSREYHDVEGGHVRIYREHELVRDLESLGLRLADRHYAHALHSPYWWIRCLFGSPEEGSVLASAWHRVLVWDLEHAPTPLGTLERWLDPLLGKSVVLYFDAPEGEAVREGAAA